MKVTTILLLLLTLGSHGAQAEGGGQDKGFFPSEDEKKTPFFDKGSWVSTAHIAYYGPEDTDDRDIRLALLNIGAETYRWNSFGFVADAYFVATRGHIVVSEEPGQLNSDSFGGGGSLGLKWHFLRGKRWSTFFNGTVGFLWTSPEFPDGGSRLNFMERIGLGLTLQLREQLNLIASYSHVHVSNGQGLVRTNPAFTGDGGYAGFVYRFDQFRIFG